MGEKVRTFIDKVTVNAKSYVNQDFEPTLINFFYGRNGAGKSTIAEEMEARHGLSWASGAPTDTIIKVYNEDYIRDNIQSYGNIPGVFTITKQNAEVKKQVDQKNKDKRDAQQKLRDERQKAEDLGKRGGALEDQYAKKVWDKTEKWRKEEFPLTQTGFMSSRKKFFSELQKYTPQQHNPSELKAMYDAVYANDPVQYKLYESFDYEMLPSSEIIHQPIISRADTSFARFIRALGNLDWVRAGHDQYHGKSNGMCPYCQQPLPPSFEADLESCYDEQYRKEIEELQRFVKEYKDALNRVYTIVTNDQKNPFNVSQDRKDALQHEFDMLMEKAKYNVSLLDQKLKEPATEIGFEFEDLTPYLHKVVAAIEYINEEIKAYMNMTANIPAQRKKCIKMVWEFLAAECTVEFAEFSAKVDALKDEQVKNDKEIRRLDGSVKEITAEVSRLNKSTVNTQKAMEEMNSMLKSIGFRGFYLREKPGASYVYELVRDTAEGTKPARGLSEGERNFLAFLYFYHEVMGSQSDDGRIDDKIVVIDDPVSSMDSGTLFVVASLIRQMVAVCYNNFNMSPTRGNDEHIRQFFCMTHNPDFFREITYNRLEQYECVSFFEIKKDKDDRSSVHPCIDDSPSAGGGKINVSPVRDYYENLWYDVRTSQRTETLMNAIRQILEFYFIRTCGYKNGNLRDELLEGENKKLFEQPQSDGTVDSTDYTIAAGMIALLNVGMNSYNDDLYFDYSAYTPDQLKAVLRKIFDVKGQLQHYNMMMGNR